MQWLSCVLGAASSRVRHGREVGLCRGRRARGPLAAALRALALPRGAHAITTAATTTTRWPIGRRRRRPLSAKPPSPHRLCTAAAAGGGSRPAGHVGGGGGRGSVLRFARLSCSGAAASAALAGVSRLPLLARAAHHR